MAEMTTAQAKRLLLNKMAMTAAPGDGGWFPSRQLRQWLKDWGVRRTRRGQVVTELVRDTKLVRQKIEGSGWYRYRLSP